MSEDNSHSNVQLDANEAFLYLPKGKKDLDKADSSNQDELRGTEEGVTDHMTGSGALNSAEDSKIKYNIQKAFEDQDINEQGNQEASGSEEESVQININNSNVNFDQNQANLSTENTVTNARAQQQINARLGGEVQRGQIDINNESSTFSLPQQAEQSSKTPQNTTTETVATENGIQEDTQLIEETEQVQTDIENLVLDDTTQNENATALSNAQPNDTFAELITTPVLTEPEPELIEQPDSDTQNETGSDDTTSSPLPPEEPIINNVVGTDASEKLKGTSGDDIIQGLAGNDKLIAHAGDDKLKGGLGDDILKAGKGDDTLEGGAGNDVLIGGKGQDTAIFSSDISDYKLTPVQNGIQVEHLTSSAQNDGIDILKNNIESFQFGDSIYTKAELKDYIVDPNVTVRVSQATDNQNTINSTDGFDIKPTDHSINESVTGEQMDIAGVSHAANISYQFDNNNSANVSLDSAWNSVKNIEVSSKYASDVTLDNFVHTDVTLGQKGQGDSSVTITDAKRGNVTTGKGNDTIDIEAFSNGSGWSNTFTVNSGKGHDSVSISGHGGHTVIDVDAGKGNDTVTLSGNYASSSISLDKGNDIFTGGSAADIVAGGHGNDSIAGNDGDDELFGDKGKDTLTGGRNNDLIDGGSGQDTAIYHGNHHDYKITWHDDGKLTIEDTVENRDGIDQLSSIETIMFSDITLSAKELAHQYDSSQFNEPVLLDNGNYSIEGVSDFTIEVDSLTSNAGYNSSFGHYFADANGTPLVGVVDFANVKDSLGKGDATTLSYRLDDLPEGASQIGFFLVPNGARLNSDLEDGTYVQFDTVDGIWTPLVDDQAISGQKTPAFFSDSSLNADSLEHMKTSENNHIAWEDLYGGGDNDFNDSTLSVSVRSDKQSVALAEQDQLNNPADQSDDAFFADNPMQEQNIFTLTDDPSSHNVNSQSDWVSLIEESPNPENSDTLNDAETHDNQQFISDQHSILDQGDLATH